MAPEALPPQIPELPMPLRGNDDANARARAGMTGLLGRFYGMRPARRPAKYFRTVPIAALVLAAACVTSPQRGTNVAVRSVAPVAFAPTPAAPVSNFGGADIPTGAMAASATADTLTRPVADTAGKLNAPARDSAVIIAEPVFVAELASTAPVAWDMEVQEHAERTRVNYFVNAYMGRSRETLQRALSRQTRYAPIISDRLRAAGLPQDLTYLALIESSYDPHAYSKAAAVGMWQFMARTAKAVGLRVDWWVDERRDPIRSTEGAVKHLSSLHDEFGSVFLSAAAYNGGSGRVNRGLTRFASRIDDAEGEDRFFALSDTKYLRPETRDYVPKMIAAALVAKQPEKYGLQIDSLQPFVFDSVLAPGGAPLAAIAKAVEAPIDEIRDLNSHLLRGMVPPGNSMWVRVPVGSATIFDSTYSSLDSTDRVALKKVVSKKGESMLSIARKHRLTSKQLGWYNPKAVKLKSGNLAPGQAIYVPSEAVAAAARDVPNPTIERYPRRSRSRPPARVSSAAKKPVAAPSVMAKPTAKAPSKR
jgi:membrane-bound lytic murein transglycosylase D